VPRTYSDWFRWIAVAEAISWTGLLIAMVFKYGFHEPEGVQVMGWIHGLIFICYVVSCLVVRRPRQWGGRVLILGLLASVPPLTSVVFERWATHHGHLESSGGTEPAATSARVAEN
jgi:integral membrane protein